MVIGACGPTTSARMDPFSPALLEKGLKVMIGKGPRSAEVIDAIVRTKALYLQAFGGCGALYANTVKSVKPVAFDHLGPEAMIELQVEGFAVIVAIDSQGGSVFTDKRVFSWTVPIVGTVCIDDFSVNSLPWGGQASLRLAGKCQSY